ncbi:MAG: serine hydrolase domain-containing protein [Candidatus Thorarchaeota archaeon]|jgi:CubicO group peptidase (beta-lactamase class C family)
MTNKEKNQTKGCQSSFLLFTSAILILSMLVGCGPSNEDLEEVEYTPLIRDDWEVSTPAEQGLDPDIVAEFYYRALELETIYSLLIVKNGYLTAEGYFNDGSIEQKTLIQSAAKSYYSTLVGIALELGCISSLDEKMVDYFPEVADQIKDPRKKQISIRDLLKMRSGYPWEESDPALWDALFTADYSPLIVHFPLVSDPGTEFHYSNLSTHWLGVIVERACETDLKSFAQEHLFSPLDTQVGHWPQVKYDQYYPHFELSARDAAKFGLMYLNEGEYKGHRVVSGNWVQESLKTYSEDAWTISVSRNFNDPGYGYQWWSVRAGNHQYSLAWGHGGQQIVLLDEFDMVIVVTANPFYQEHNDQAWKHEKASLNLVADFIASLPSE